MKKSFALVLLGLTFSGTFAYADNEEKYNVNQHNFSRQPFMKVPDKDQLKDQGFEGATLVKESSESQTKSQNLQLNRFDRRPYVKKAVE